MPPGTDARTCETLHIKVIAVAPCHFREELRLRRGLHLVQRRKAAAVVSLKIVRGKSDGGEKLLLRLEPAVRAAGTCHRFSHVAEEHFRMQVLAPLIDLVEHAQEGSSAYARLVNADAAGNGIIIDDGYSPDAERSAECGDEVCVRIPHGDYKAAADARSYCPVHRENRKLRVQLIAPFAGASADRPEVVYHLYVTDVGRKGDDGGIACVRSWLHGNEDAVIVERERRDFRAVPGIEIIAAPVLRSARPFEIGRVRDNASAAGVDAEFLERIRDIVQKVQRVGIKTRGNVRIALSHHVHHAGKSPAGDASLEPEFRFGSEVRREQGQRRRGRERLERARRGEIVASVHFREFLPRLHGTHGRSEAHARSDGIRDMLKFGGRYPGERIRGDAGNENEYGSVHYRRRFFSLIFRLCTILLRMMVRMSIPKTPTARIHWNMLRCGTSAGADCSGAFIALCGVNCCVGMSSPSICATSAAERSVVF